MSKATAPSDGARTQKITRADIEAGFSGLAGEVQEAKEAATPVLTVVAVVGAIAVIGLTFILGKRRGRISSTVVEIRRV